MLSINCPFGKIVCDGCSYLTTIGCSYDRSKDVYTITKEQSDELWERRRNELLSLPKETLVEMIMGRRGVYC